MSEQVEQERKSWAGEISKLDVCEDLIKLAIEARARGSIYVNTWADTENMTRWANTVTAMRNIIPKKILREYDEGRKRFRHREGCKCVLCKKGRA